jgi:uncharacterized protein (TIGR02271 family)
VAPGPDRLVLERPGLRPDGLGKQRHEAGRARLRKYVVTEEETCTVPVSRDEVRIEREPITDANVDDALSGPDIL